MTDYGSDLHLVRLTPEFSRLCAILGYRLKETIQWAPYARLVHLHGWKRLLKAIERCEPGKRWASDAERECQAMERDELSAAQEWEARQRRVVPVDCAERAALFREIRKRVLGA